MGLWEIILHNVSAALLFLLLLLLPRPPQQIIHKRNAPLRLVLGKLGLVQWADSVLFMDARVLSPCPAASYLGINMNVLSQLGSAEPLLGMLLTGTAPPPPPKWD